MHEHGELDLSDIASSLQAMVIFQNMRTNLAMIMSFVRRSLPKDSNLEQYDIGLLNVPPGEAQLATHTHAVTCFLAALLSQCLDNYKKMKTVRPDLEHAGLESGSRWTGGSVQIPVGIDQGAEGRVPRQRLESMEAS